MVKYKGQTKAGKDSKYRGYRVQFELTGLYNGPLSVFTRSSDEYKMYFDPKAWNVERLEVEYRPLDEADGEPFTRSYAEPQVIDLETGEWRPADKNCSIMAKVQFALKNKFRLYDAYVDGKKLFDDENTEDNETGK